MGQRILITEEERSRIKNLYEVSTPPPSESVLVTNKNPFKYPEFEDARKIYSPQLKDGDRFYQTTGWNYDNFFENNENSPFRKLYDSFIGKTIRLNSEDKIVKIEKVYQPNDINFKHNDLGDINDNSIYFEVKIDYFVYSINYDSKTNSIKILRLSSYGDSSPSDELLPVLSSIANKLKTTYIDYFKDLTQIPDELFEIRKIQRETTDF